MRRSSLAIILLILATLNIAATAQTNPFLGKWDITGEGRFSNQVYWLEVREENGKLAGTFLNRRGSVLPLPEIAIVDGELIFSIGARPNQPKPVHRARVEDGRLLGRLITGDPESGEIPWSGLRPPQGAQGAQAPGATAQGAQGAKAQGAQGAKGAKEQSAEHNANDRKNRLGTPVQLFNGENLQNWLLQDPEKPSGWVVVDGAMTNEAKANNLISKHQFENFKLVAEYKIEPKSNSGIFLRGRYEVQVVDDFGQEPSNLGHAALYSRVKPTANASLAPGEWQLLEAIIVGNRLTVTLNRKRVHDNVVIDGITGGALDSREGAPGPIMIQGDHGKVTFRRIVVTPIINLK